MLRDGARPAHDVTSLCLFLFDDLGLTYSLSSFSVRSFVCDSCTSAQALCTPAFQAPEQLTRMADAVAIPPFTGDVWALGCVLFCFVYGRCSAAWWRGVLLSSGLSPLASFLHQETRMPQE